MNMAQISLTSRTDELSKEIGNIYTSLCLLKENRSDYARQHVALLHCYSNILGLLKSALAEENEYVSQLQSMDDLEHTPVL